MLSLAKAYLSWLIGGLLGMHLVYLGRPRQALFHAITLGYCGIATILDGFYIKSYYNQLIQGPEADESGNTAASDDKANDDDEATDKDNVEPPKKKKRGVFSFSRLWSQAVVGSVFGGIATCLMPRDVYAEMDQEEGVIASFVLFSLGSSIGVWAAGNVEYVKVSLIPILIAAGVSYAAFDMINYPRTVMFECVVAVYFQRAREEDRLTIKPTGFTPRNLLSYYMKLLLFAILLGVAVNNHGTMQTSKDDKATASTYYVHDSFHEFLESEDVATLKASVKVAWQRVQNEGLYSFANSVYVTHFMDEEKEAFRVLGLAKDATAKEIKKQYRKLSLEFHPDKWASAGEYEKEAAKSRFIEAKTAYEFLTNKGGDAKTEG